MKAPRLGTAGLRQPTPERPCHHPWNECRHLKPPPIVPHPKCSASRVRSILSRAVDGSRQVRSQHPEAPGDVTPIWDTSLVLFLLCY